ncbi:MAG TPA: radical SAM family heme chaperone HemW [Spirochaetota bacterium]|jgi:oxygen-independent coproporphyrinogen-3 oxidase|nr:radical SAM family heme chaperone HemW [Spirochaetota bacterium]HOQ13217.1 radical SAM family heme chaperone HemW [Spirochaetota bacterium]HOV08688.1 radical SAM family heme chaperone HemW [Spirochaetota bacterium]HPD77388.1 radical SAM family heme chaperone HemW [Spirochaetota bacterium]HPX90636.1 radical SAM family heme chaperone HemW [Spirochaetota bacterium]
MDPCGIYIHVPFCKKKCDYCSFYSVPLKDEVILEQYVSRLCDEISSCSDVFPSLADTIYFGGGTPSLLKEEHLEKIISAVKNRFELSKGAEITLEMNPEDFSHSKIDSCLKCGINRIVLGVQSLDVDLRRFIGRSTALVPDKTLKDFLSRSDFIRCVDLIAGIPGQTKEEIIYELEYITNLQPDHISLYLLSLEDGTSLKQRFPGDNEFSDFQARIWEVAIDYLVSKGFDHYEISNFAKPGFISRHNSKYWHFLPYAGFGPGAHSFTGKVRYYNDMSVEDYIAEEFNYNIDIRTGNDVIVEFIITALRDLHGFSYADFERVTGIKMPDDIHYKIQLYITHGYMSDENGKIKLSRKGMFKSNLIIYSLADNYILS